MNIRVWGTSLLMFLSTVTAVGQTANRYLKAPLPQDWEESGEVFQQILPVDDHWWKSFQDAKLDSLIALAVDRNYSVAMAINRIAAARANLWIERSNFFPSIGLNAGWTRQETSGNTSSLPQTTDHYYDASLSMSWELDIFGSIRKRVKAQKENFAASKEEQQHDDMVSRMRMMYENDSSENYVNLLLQGGGLSGMLNRMDFVESVYEYDRQKLQEYEETKEQVLALWNQLEEEKTQLQVDKDQLEADKADLENQKSELDVMLAKKKQESANYDAEIKKAKQEASVAKALLQQEQKQLKQLQAKAQQGNTAAATGTYATTNYTSVIESASGSDMGKRLAKYACQYIGNPYVAGGTSLTNGADCSGFTFRVYSDFGYSIPRTSYEQRSCGTGVDYSNAQPGDLICYDGHVAMYIGGGLIVHASTQRTGIKISNANYRPILAVRRVV